jgi:Complex I intermediate-associated protein 30 (CIA30)
VLDIPKSDGKTYTLVLKDELLPLRDDGREQSTVSWGADFTPAKAEREGEGTGETVQLKWADFKATYRGKEKDDTGRLKMESVKRASVMCRK